MGLAIILKAISSWLTAGEIPCFKLLETDTALAFMDIGPIARGHCLVIPKCTRTAVMGC